jgi:hypothetical protein
MKKINYSIFQTPHYFDQLMLFFLIICFILTLAIIDTTNGFDINFILTYAILLFLILAISVLIEMKNKSEYISPIETIHIRQFFNNFNNSKEKKEFVHKYNSKTLKQLKKNIKADIKYQLTNIIKKNNIYDLHISENPRGDKLYIFKFLFRKNNHKLTIQKDKNNSDIKIIKIN